MKCVNCRGTGWVSIDDVIEGIQGLISCPLCGKWPRVTVWGARLQGVCDTCGKEIAKDGSVCYNMPGDNVSRVHAR